MSANRRRKRRVLTGALGLGSAGIVGAGLLAVIGNSASAATVEVDPSTDRARAEKVLKDCDNPSGSGASCTWSDVKVVDGTDKLELVQDNQGVAKWVNCGSTQAEVSVQWAHTSSHDWFLGTDASATFELNGLFAGYKVTASVSHKIDFEDSKAFSSTSTILVPPGQTGWLVHGSKRIKGTGTLTAKIGGDDLVLRNVSLDAPKADDSGTISAHTRKHNGEDTAICQNAPATVNGVEDPSEGLVESTDGGDLPLRP